MSATFFKSSAESPWRAARQAASARENEVRRFTGCPSLLVVIIVPFSLCGFFPGLLFKLVGAGDFGVGTVAEIVKQRRAIRLGPKPHFSGLLERIVFPY